MTYTMTRRRLSLLLHCLIYCNLAEHGQCHANLDVMRFDMHHEMSQTLTKSLSAGGREKGLLKCSQI